MLKSLLTGIVALAAMGSAFAQDAAPAAPARRQGQAQRRPIPVCAMRLEPLKDPAKAVKSTFAGKDVLLCCENCKAAFEKLDDAAKEKTVKKAGLTSRKLGLKRQLEQVEKQLLELDGKPANTTVAVPAAPAGKLYCAITGEDIESAEKAAGKATFNGKTYYFCCAGCVKKFDTDKAKYAALADEAAAKRGK